MNPDIPASSSDASQHSAMPLQRSRADILKPLCIAYARAAAKLASTAVATDRSLSGSAHVTLLPPPTEDHAPDGATVDMYDVAEPIDRPLVDLLNVIRNLTAMGRKLDVDSQHQPSLASRTRSDVDHELSAPCLHGGVRLTRAEILQTRADLEAQREVLESIQRTMSGGQRVSLNECSLHHAISHCDSYLSDAGRGPARTGRSCPLPICDPSSPPSLPSLDRVGDASSEAAPSPEVEQQLDAVRRREQQWKLAAEAAVVAARAMKEAAHVTRMGAAAEIASWQQTAETAVRTLTRAETEILSWQQQATTAMRRLDRAETAAAVEKVEAEDLLRRLAELELENTR